MNGQTTTPIQEESVEKKKSITSRWCRFFFLKTLNRLQHGKIVLHEGEKTWVFGKGDEPRAHITVLSGTFYSKVLFGGSIGAGETYVDKIWEVDDLTALVRIMVLNMSLLDRMERGFAWLLRPLYLVRHFLNINSKKGSKRNILAHYDLGNTMYESFLDPAMMYSAAIYPEAGSSLEEASLHKLDTICKKLDLQPNDRVIEIGTGWGGFALHAARNYGCHITTTTISDAQYLEAKKRVAAAGLTDKITLLKKDYRELTGKYDKLVSIEMIEAVGHRFLPGYFKKCGELLKADGLMLLQAITISDQKYKQYARSVDFIQRYIFPGGCIPSNTVMLQHISRQSDMVVRGIEDFGFHYARTLKDWRSRFNESFASLRSKGYDDTFKRLWEFYLCYCEGGFLERSISVVHLVAARPGNRQT